MIIKTCQWPIGDLRRGGHRCESPSVEAGQPYCLEHCRAAWPDYGMKKKSSKRTREFDRLAKNKAFT